MTIVRAGEEGLIVDNDPAIEAGENSVILHRPLDELPADTGAALTEWLEQHDVDPRRVALDAPIERDEMTMSVTWREVTPEGVIMRRKYPAVSRLDGWPAPFPQDLVAFAEHASKTA